MKQKKRELSLYPYYDLLGIARHLEDMARQGWQLEKIGSTLWHYRRAEPADIRYAAVCFAKATELDSEPSREQRDFWEMCQSTGWQLAANRAQLQVFCNPDPDAVPIETDPVVQVENLRSGLKKALLTPNLVVAVCALLQVILQFSRTDDLVDFLTSSFAFANILIWVTLGIHGLWEALSYLRWLRRAEVAARSEGILLPVKSRRWRQVLLLVMCAVYILLIPLMTFTVPGHTSFMWFCLIFGAVYATLLAGTVRVSQWLMKKKGVSPTTNRVLSGVIGSVVGGILLFGMMELVLSDRVNLQIQGHANAEVITYTSADGSRTYTYDFYRDDLPLTVEALLGTDADPEYSRQLNVSGTFLLTEHTIRQRIPYYGNTDKPDLVCTVWEVGLDRLYEPVKKSFFKADEYRIHGMTFSIDRELRGIDAAPWGAVDAYQYYQEGEPYSTYLLCYEERFVKIRFDGWNEAAPTAEQMALIGETLGHGALG